MQYSVTNIVEFVLFFCALAVPFGIFVKAAAKATKQGA